jgi:hypothetical protein
MTGAAISRTRLGAAHDGVAEMIVTLRYDNGGESEVALCAHAAGHLMAACGATAPEALIGARWERVRDALAAASNRFVRAEAQDQKEGEGGCTIS